MAFAKRKALNSSNLEMQVNLLAALKKIEEDAEKEANDVKDMDKVQYHSLIDRTLRVLDVGIEKLKVALVLPFLLRNKTELNKYLSKTNVQKLYKNCESYFNDTAEPNLSANNIDYRIVKSFETLHDNKIFLKSLPVYLEHVSSEDEELLKAMINLRKTTEIRMKTSATTEVAMERLLHQIFHDNQKTKDIINTIEAQLRQKGIILRWKIAAKQAVIKKYQEDLAFKKWENSIKVKKTIVRANDEMEKIYIKNEEFREGLQDECNRLEKEYQDLLEKNIKQDSILRYKMNAITTELQQLITKYDTDIVEKIGQNEEAEAEKLRVETKLNAALEEFYRQEEDYKRLYEEKQNEKDRVQQEKMMMFMMNRAARTIQRYYRLYTKAKKKKRGKGKGKGRRK